MAWNGTTGTRRDLLGAGAMASAGVALTRFEPARANAGDRPTEERKTADMTDSGDETLRIKSHSDFQPWTRFTMGDATISVVSDGKIAIGDPRKWFIGLKEGELEAALRDNFLSETTASLAQNIMIVDIGARRVMFDTGTGGAPLIGPTAGHLLNNLRSAGIEPSSITDIILSHGHPDHVLGLVDASGAGIYERAQVHVSEADFRLMSGDPVSDDPFWPELNRQITAVADRVAMIADGQEVAPGITAIAAPGHTLGHTIFAIDSGGRTLLNAADLGHHHAIFPRHPEVNFVADADPAMMVAMRRRLYDMIATDRLGFLAYHFPFPGIGHLSRVADAYAWVPASLDTV